MQSVKTKIFAIVISFALLSLGACTAQNEQNSEVFSSSNTPSTQSETTPPQSSSEAPSSIVSPSQSESALPLSSESEGGLTIDDAEKKLSAYLADNYDFVEGSDYLEYGNEISVFDTACFSFDWRNGPHKEGIEDRLAENFAISTDGSQIFHYDRGKDAWAEADSEPTERTPLNSPSSESQSEIQEESSVDEKEESATSSKTPDLTGFVKDEAYSLYSKIVSCSVENDVITVVFFAYAESLVNADVSMDIWISDNNGDAKLAETYAIGEAKGVQHFNV